MPNLKFDLIALTCCFNLIVGAFVLKDLTEWSGWIAYPIGAFTGILLTLAMWFLLPLASFCFEKIEKK